MDVISIEKKVMKNQRNTYYQLIAVLLFVGAQFVMPSLSYSKDSNDSVDSIPPPANKHTTTDAATSANPKNISPTTTAKPWSKSALQKVIQQSDDALKGKNWQAAITLGEQALAGCIERMSERDRRCIRVMKNNSLAYYRAGEIESNAKKIEKAYRLASSELGPMHFSTIRIREVFHELVLDQERYATAIPLVKELIAVERETGKDEFKILNWQIQLYALYKIEGHVKQEIPMLEKMANLTEKLMGRESEQLYRTVTVLAETYCTQKKYYEFYELVRKYKIKQSCK